MIDILTLFRPDLHRLCVRQSDSVAGMRSRLDELFPALRIAAGAAVRHHVANSFCRVQQSAVCFRRHADRRDPEKCRSRFPKSMPLGP